jgi:3-phenylpropionate/trans-cinnamate dioxygenase ferredoxin reductase component
VAVGDVARHVNPRFDTVARRTEHWCMPGLGAKQAARTLLGVAGPLFAPVPSLWTEQCGLRLDGYGLPSLAHGWELVSGSYDGSFVTVGTRDGETVAVLGVDTVREVTAIGRTIGSERLLAATPA